MVSKGVFLSTIWNRSRGTYVYLPVRDKAGRWSEGQSMTATEAADRAAFMAAGSGDLYFSPLRYYGPRQAGSVGLPGVIFADLDGDHQETPRLTPSAIVVSSVGHYHAYWLLDEPAGKEEWEAHSKGWTQEIGGDPAGWDITQVLRLPGSKNHKYSPVEDVTLQSFHPENVYNLNDFPVAEILSPLSPDCPEPNKESRDEWMYDPLLPLSTRYWLTVTKEELRALGTIDRSKVLWALMRQLLEAGLAPSVVFNLVFFSSVNKWPKDPSRLWSDVQRAVAAS